MSRNERIPNALQELSHGAAGAHMTPHDYLAALQEAFLALRSFGCADVWRQGDRSELLIRLLRARVVAETEGSTWAEYKEALGLTG